MDKENGQKDERVEVIEPNIQETEIPETEEVIETDSCKIIMDKDGNIHIDCSKPTEKLRISKQELDMLQSLSELTQKNNK